MNRTFTLFIALLLSFASFGQAPDGYYNDAEGKNGQELKVALYNIIKTHDAIGYGGLYEAYKKTDAREDDPTKVLDMYTDIPGGTPKVLFTHIADKNAGSAKFEGDNYNREHTVPQSWFKKASTPRCDLFHVYPTDSWVNNLRGSYPHGDVAEPASKTTNNGSKLGNCSDGGYTGTVFEPIDEYKGDIARSYLYMITCYHDQVASWASNSSTATAVMTGKSFPSIKPWYVKLLLKWHHNDPVSPREIKRNNEAYKIQHNRNPFIDHPEYADAIWKTDAPSINSITVEDQSFSTDSKVHFSVDYTAPNGAKSVAVNWGTTESDLSNKKALTLKSNNNYTIDVDPKMEQIFFTVTVTDSKDKTTTSSVKKVVNSDLAPTALLTEEFSAESTQFETFKNAGAKALSTMNGTVRFNAYGGSEAANIWYVSKSLDLTGTKSFALSLDVKTKYADGGIAEPFKVLYSFDYTTGDPATSGTWNEMNLDLPAANSNTLVTDITSGDINVEDNKTVYIAFHYESSGTGGGATSMWDVDRVEITAKSASTGVNDFEISQNIQVLPNPASEYIRINNAMLQNKIEKVEIYNIMGSMEKIIPVSRANSVDLSINDLVSGVYIMKIYTTKGDIVMKKFLKR